MNSSKKAQIEINFNWLFVLIAGAAILFFFVKVIGSEIDYSESISHTQAVSRMNTMISAIQQNPDSINTNNVLKYELYFECTIEGQSYGIKNSNARDTLSHNLVYTPDVIGDSKLIAWVRTLGTPHPVAPVLYLTDEKTKYVFLQDADDGLVTYFYNLFPRDVPKELTTLDHFKTKGDEGYRQYIVVMNEELSTENFGFENNIKLASKIKYFISIDKDTNKINFYELQDNRNFLTPNPESKHYLTEENIIGAIISGQPDLYECVMNKVLEQTKIITNLNLDRIIKIRAAYGEDDPCYGRYSPSILQQYFKDLSDATQIKNYEDIITNMRSIESANNQLRMAGCALIY